MSIDLSGGLDVSREHVFAERPHDPEMRDAVNMWISDDRGAVGLPRFAVEALASKWEAHDVSLNIAYPSGRVLSMRASGATHAVLSSAGTPSVLGAGPLRFECHEPFRKWTASFRGTAAQMTTAEQMAGALPGQGAPVEVAFEIETFMATPPWVQGQLSADAAARLQSGFEGGYMGGRRYEQLFRARGELRVGDRVQRFTGSGLRIRRQGVRRLEGFWGHCWQSALFPSGRGFGYIAYPPRDDGAPSYNEGYVYEGDGPLIPARVVDAPWLRALRGNGEDVSVVLETAHGRVEIQAETTLSTYAMGRPEMPPDFPVLQQAGARYRWNGEETYGMLERSSRKDRIMGMGA